MTGSDTSFKKSIVRIRYGRKGTRLSTVKLKGVVFEVEAADRVGGDGESACDVVSKKESATER